MYQPADFYPRSPCGERPLETLAGAFLFPISIHALLAESDHGRRVGLPAAGHFYPRSPCGERPVQIIVIVMYALISIHALLAESDMAALT